MTFRPWHWQPSLANWFTRMVERAGEWQPCAELSLEPDPLRTRLHQAAKEGAGWLWHPCTDRLTTDSLGTTWQRDLQLAVWVVLHSEASADEFGGVRVPQPAPVWTRHGAVQVTSGTHALADLATGPPAGSSPCEPGVDVWGESIGYAEPESWAALPPRNPDEMRVLTEELGRYYRCSLFLARAMPACHAWIAGATRISIPLRGAGDGFRSCSHPGVPGLVLLDLLKEHQIIEALVHESAHLYLYRAEVSEPLVDPDNQERYRSPLRPEPRPLRGILLAYHALAYIAAMYREALDIPLVAQWGTSEMADRREQAHEAEEVLLTNRRHLTRAGKDFLDKTRLVLEYSNR